MAWEAEVHHERRDTNSSSADHWGRFGQMFGARWADNFGPRPSAEWSQLFAELRPDQISGAFSRVKDHQPPYPGWLPSLPEFSTFARAVYAMPAQKDDPGRRYPRWLAAVNMLFILWLQREIADENRRVSGARSIPDGEMYVRRQICRKLADDFSGMELEGDPEATRSKLREAFQTQMRLIPVSNAA